MKYPINKEFFPFASLTPPIPNAESAGRMGSLLRPPIWVRNNTDEDVNVTKETIKSYDGAEISLFIFEPRGNIDRLPCLVYYHGGGFFFDAAWYHYKLAKKYAIEAMCRVIFVQYRLSPKNPHPTPSEDCYASLVFAYENAERLNLDSNRIAVGGDSAGGALAAAVCQMARDRGTDIPYFQLLVYPVTDRRMDYDSCRNYTDTPMWNSRLSKIMWEGYVKDVNASDIAYASPMEAKSFDRLPSAYVETAEFDCLHDEGVAYARALSDAGAKVILNETKGTPHGFDIVAYAETTKSAIAKRIKYMKKLFCPINTDIT